MILVVRNFRNFDPFIIYMEFDVYFKARSEFFFFFVSMRDKTGY